MKVTGLKKIEDIKLFIEKNYNPSEGGMPQKSDEQILFVVPDDDYEKVREDINAELLKKEEHYVPLEGYHAGPIDLFGVKFFIDSKTHHHNFMEGKWKHTEAGTQPADGSMGTSILNYLHHAVGCDMLSEDPNKSCTCGMHQQLTVAVENEQGFRKKITELSDELSNNKWAELIADNTNLKTQIRVNADLLDNANDNAARFKEWGERMAAQVHYLTNQKQATANTLNAISEEYAKDSTIMSDEVAESVEGIVKALITPDPIQPVPPEPPQKKFVFSAKIQGHDADDVEQALKFALEDFQENAKAGSKEYKVVSSAAIVKLHINEHQTFASFKTEQEAYLKQFKEKK